jgi:hypothetical protein
VGRRARDAAADRAAVPGASHGVHERADADVERYTKRLDRLEQAGLIREPDPDDRRGTLIALTDAGRELIDGVTEAHLENERRLLSALSDDEQHRLATSCASFNWGCRRTEAALDRTGYWRVG